MEKGGWFFLCGCAALPHYMLCAREKQDLAEEGVTASGVYMWNDNLDGDPWRVYETALQWRVVSMATAKPEGGNRLVVAVGGNNQFFEVEPATRSQTEGVLEPAGGPYRRVAVLGDSFVVVGMGRDALHRQDVGRWTAIGPEAADTDPDAVVGFEGLAGVSAEDFYAVGWGGEIWQRSGTEWRQIDSPTNANLNAAALAEDGTVYAVGDNGSMVAGSGDTWSVIETNRPENLQDVAVFGDEVFVVTDFRILRLIPEGLVNEDRFAGGDTPDTCLHLLKGDGVVMSLGPTDLFRFTGDQWERIL